MNTTYHSTPLATRWLLLSLLMIVGGPVLLGGAAGTLAVLLSPIMAVLAAISAHRSGKKGVLALAVALLTITGFCAIVALAVIFPTVVSTSVLESATGL